MVIRWSSCSNCSKTLSRGGPGWLATTAITESNERLNSRQKKSYK